MSPAVQADTEVCKNLKLEPTESLAETGRTAQLGPVCSQITELNKNYLGMVYFSTIDIGAISVRVMCC